MPFLPISMSIISVDRLFFDNSKSVCNDDTAKYTTTSHPEQPGETFPQNDERENDGKYWCEIDINRRMGRGESL
jgi:hypothetical protein